MKFRVDEYKDYDFAKSSMAENRGFLYEVVKAIKPGLITELGTYYGCSYFSFAEAIENEGLDTKLVGVDTWGGDIHTGYYNDTVFETFQALLAAYFDQVANFSTIRTTFADAVDNFADNSIDILMIDGTHTAEAVKEDYEAYLPKLAENGIVLFHDTNVNRFTLKEYWQKLAKKHVSYNFKNRYGLGVLAPKGIANFAKIQHLFDAPKTTIYTAIYGDKDDLKPQVFQNYPTKKLLITDSAPQNWRGWQVVEIDFKDTRHPRLKAKGFKVVPHLFPPKHTADYLIWIDGNIKITSTRFVEFMIESLGDKMVGFLPHPDRNCIYKEYDACIEHGRLVTDEDKKVALDQLIRYKKDKFMPEMGLYAGTVFIRNLKHPRINEFNELWGIEIMEGSFRDQLSLPYVLWKMGEKPAVIDLNLWSNEYFTYGKHKK